MGFLPASSTPVSRWLFLSYTDSQANGLQDIRLSRLLLILHINLLK